MSFETLTIGTCCCSVRSPQWLRGKWWSMKRHVTGYQEMTFPGLSLLSVTHNILCIIISY